MQIYYFDSVPTTMSIAWQYPVNSLIVAKEQTAGKGKPGRQWISTRGNLFCSYKILRQSSTFHSEHLAIIYGLKILQLSQWLTNYQATFHFKYPNDVYMNGKKLAGVLVECMDQYAVIGIGVNINNAPEGFSCLLDYNVNISINYFIYKLFNHI